VTQVGAPHLSNKQRETIGLCSTWHHWVPNKVCIYEYSHLEIQHFKIRQDRTVNPEDGDPNRTDRYCLTHLISAVLSAEAFRHVVQANRDFYTQFTDIYSSNFTL
jgi:hypothetical protein